MWVKKFKIPFGILAAFFVLGGTILLGTGMAWLSARATGERVDPQRIVRYVRDRFGVSDSVKMTVSPVKHSTIAAYDEGNITVDDGKTPQTQPFLVSLDGRYLMLGQTQALDGEMKASIEQHLRTTFKIPPNLQLKVGDLRQSPYPDLQVCQVTLVNGAREQSQEVYVAPAARTLLIGSFYNLTQDPVREALRTIVTANQPSVGPDHAPVTVVEYADLQCPTCAVFHKFLETEFLPKYEDKVKLVFKDFPLIGTHDWSPTAAVASQCVYQLDPPAFLRFRTLVFANQGAINAANVRDQMLQFADQLGVDRVALASCVDSKASMPRIEETLREVKELGVTRTPTTFINGHIVVGMPQAEEFFKKVNEALTKK